MDFSNIPNDVLIFILSSILGIVIGFFHAKMGNIENPIWPIKLYLTIIGTNPLTSKQYKNSRNHFLFREQFMTASFIWFFIIFILLLFIFDEFRRYG